jgi:lipopolysaccharide transport system ATP-binding protein
LSDIVISVENLSKRYLVGHRSDERERYTALRDVIAREARNFARKAFDAFRGRQIVQGDEVEEFWALKDVSFEVKRGEVIGIIGRNGAGKSTLLKIMSRITEPTEGRIRLRGRVASLLEVGTGFHPELTGRENIFLNGAILGMSRRAIRRKFDEIVAFADIEKFLDTSVKHYSSGMYVRLAFAVAAHLETDILLIDEVLAVGDAQFQKKSMGRMKEATQQDGRTVILVSHQMGVIGQLCERVMSLSIGQLTYSGETKRGIERYLETSDVENSAFIVADPDLKNLAAGIDSVTTCGSDKIHKSTFSYVEPINIQVRFRCGEYIPSLHLGIGLENRSSDRVTTWVARISDHVREIRGEHQLNLCVSPGIIAPNLYAFTVALFVPRGRVHHVLTGICPIRIHDSGSKLALFEGMDYGSVIVPARWTQTC